MLHTATRRLCRLQRMVKRAAEGHREEPSSRLGGYLQRVEVLKAEAAAQGTPIPCIGGGGFKNEIGQDGH